MSSQSDELTMIQNAVLKPTNLSTFVDNNQTNIEANPEKSKLLTTPVSGYDFNKGINYSELFKSYTTTGFQATNFGRAIEEIELMVCFITFEKLFINFNSFFSTAKKLS